LRAFRIAARQIASINRRTDFFCFRGIFLWQKPLYVVKMNAQVGYRNLLFQSLYQERGAKKWQSERLVPRKLLGRREQRSEHLIIMSSSKAILLKAAMAFYLFSNH